jgi:hypothetical protein
MCKATSSDSFLHIILPSVHKKRPIIRTYYESEHFLCGFASWTQNIY